MKHPFSHYQQYLGPTKHCEASVVYVAKQKSLKAAWLNCTDPSWLWWLIDDLVDAKVLNRKYLVSIQNIRKIHEDKSRKIICNNIRKAVPYLAVIRAFKRFAKALDKQQIGKELSCTNFQVLTNSIQL